MNETQEIVITCSKKLNRQERLATATTIAIIFVVSGATATTPFSSSFGFRNIFLYLGLWVLVFGISTTFFYIRRSKPVAILNQQGIWANHYGLIPWTNIKEIFAFPMSRKGNNCTIEIEVKDSQAVVKQADWYGRLSLWRTSPKLNLTYLDINHEAVDRFAQQYLPKN